MATKVHDKEDENFEEIDFILAQAKLELHRDRCRERKSRRNMNLSDIPENFAHVPSCESEPNSRPPSFDTSQPDFANRDRSRARLKSNQKQLLSFMTPVKWLRGYMGCLMAVDGNCDMNGVSGCMISGPEYAFSPTRAPRQRAEYC